MAKNEISVFHVPEDLVHLLPPHTDGTSRFAVLGTVTVREDGSLDLAVYSFHSFSLICQGLRRLPGVRIVAAKPTEGLPRGLGGDINLSAPAVYVRTGPRSV